MIPSGKVSVPHSTCGLKKRGLHYLEVLTLLLELVKNAVTLVTLVLCGRLATLVLYMQYLL